MTPRCAPPRAQRELRRLSAVVWLTLCALLLLAVADLVLPSNAAADPPRRRPGTAEQPTERGWSDPALRAHATRRAAAAATRRGAADSGRRDASPARPPRRAWVPGAARAQLWSTQYRVTTPRVVPDAAGGHNPAVAPHEARLVVRDPTPDALARTLATPGVAFATAAFVADVPLRAQDPARPTSRDRMRVAFVEPEGFRRFAPAVTAQSEAVWGALRGTGAVVTHGAARRLSVDVGDGVVLGDHHVVRVDAAVSLGLPQLADGLMAAGLRDTMTEHFETVLLVSVVDPGARDAVRDALAGADVGAVEPVEPPHPHVARLDGVDERTVRAFEPFAFVPGPGGTIGIDPGWVQRNIVTEHMPVLGEMRCHRLIMPQLRAALEELEASGLSVLLDAGDYGGCYVPRHIDRSSSKPLSMHAWGVAFDVNVQSNMLGAAPQLDPRIVEVFERHGFHWGGRWRRPDGMHFEFAALLD